MNIGKTVYLADTDILHTTYTREGDVIFNATAEPSPTQTSELQFPVRRTGATTYRLWWSGIKAQSITIPVTGVTITRKRKVA